PTTLSQGFWAPSAPSVRRTSQQDKGSNNIGADTLCVSAAFTRQLILDGTAAVCAATVALHGLPS
ncbi:MAG: hypothetical protein ACKPKO_06275, partial [Candidatus Fonsibacter sp.]